MCVRLRVLQYKKVTFPLQQLLPGLVLHVLDVLGQRRFALKALFQLLGIRLQLGPRAVELLLQLELQRGRLGGELLAPAGVLRVVLSLQLGRFPLVSVK